MLPGRFESVFGVLFSGLNRTLPEPELAELIAAHENMELVY